MWAWLPRLQQSVSVVLHVQWATTHFTLICQLLPDATHSNATSLVIYEDAGTTVTSSPIAVLKAYSAGSYKPAIGTACVDCTPGFSQAGAVATQCDACTAGLYQAGAAGTVCAQCAAGTFSAATASSQCTACAMGKYIDTPASSACSQCSAGRYNSATGQGSPETTSWPACAPGTYSATAASTCTLCERGYVASSSAASACSACAVG